MTMPSSMVVAAGDLDELAIGSGEGAVEADGGNTMRKARIPLFADLTMLSRYVCVREAESCGGPLSLRGDGVRSKLA